MGSPRPPLDRAKQVENALKQMRALLEDAERRVEKGQLYTAYQRFRSMKHCAYMGAEALSRSTLKAAMDWGHAFSIRDKDGKHTGYGIMGD